MTAPRPGPTDADREAARAITDRASRMGVGVTVPVIAAALAAEREAALAPVLALADEYEKASNETWGRQRAAISYDFDVIAMQIRAAAGRSPATPTKETDHA